VRRLLRNKGRSTRKKRILHENQGELLLGKNESEACPNREKEKGYFQPCSLNGLFALVFSLQWEEGGMGFADKKRKKNWLRRKKDISSATESRETLHSLLEGKGTLTI